MGKATIISHVGAGEYVVNVEYDSEYLEALLQHIEEVYLRLELTDKVNAIATKNAAQAALVPYETAAQNAINAYASEQSEANLKAMEAAVLELYKNSVDYYNAIYDYELVVSRMEALAKRRTLIANHAQSKRRDILWCADLSDGKGPRRLLAADDIVSTIEVNGDEELGQIIYPDWTPSEALYDGTRDGRLMNVAGLTHFELFYNKAIMPAWQRWRHRFRTGVITGGNPDDGWEVTLDHYYSQDQRISVNAITPGTFEDEQRILSAVHAQYMNCDDYAFTFKDHVVLDVTITGPADGYITSATIIGFVDHPKPCTTVNFGYYDSTTGGAEWQKVSFVNGSWQMTTPYSSSLQAVIGITGAHRSWSGYDADLLNAYSLATRSISNATAIYLAGSLLAPVPTDQSWKINGFAASPEHKWVYAIMAYSTTSRTFSVMRKNFNPIATGDYYDAVTAPDGWQVVDTFTLGTEFYAATATTAEFSFNRSCSHAITMLQYTHGAKRTPQLTPAGGATAWLNASSLYGDVTDYSDYWYERVEIALSNIEDDTPGNVVVALTEAGRDGYITHKEIDYVAATFTESDPPATEPDWTGTADVTRNNTVEMAGTYIIKCYYIGDTEVKLGVNGSGIIEQQHAGQIEYDNFYSYHTLYDGYSYIGAYGTKHVCEAFNTNIINNYITRNDTGSGSNESGYGSRSYYQSGGVGYVDESSVLRHGMFVGNYNNSTQTSISSSTGPSSYSWSTSDVLTDSGLIKIDGGTVDSSSFEVSNVDDSGTEATSLGALGLSLSEFDPRNGDDSLTVEEFYDVTACNHAHYRVTNGGAVVNHKYDNIYAARHVIGVCAGWRSTLNSTETATSDTFLTGGDIDALDELPSPPAIYGIHPI